MSRDDVLCLMTAMLAGEMPSDGRLGQAIATAERIARRYGNSDAEGRIATAERSADFMHRLLCRVAKRLGIELSGCESPERLGEMVLARIPENASTAYVMMIAKSKSQGLFTLDVFSERNPTFGLDASCMPLAEFSAEDYCDAHERAIDYLADLVDFSPSWAAVLSDRVRDEVMNRFERGQTVKGRD